jgi:UDP-GlcNAc:undecaprenyl-phosphate GlcNAc-1-phosphate transferase
MADRLGLVDVPWSAPHKRHDRSVPLAGGFVVLLTVLGTGMLTGVMPSPEGRAVLLPSLVVFLFGVWDDARGLSVPAKFTGQGLAAFWLIRSGVVVQLFDATLGWLNVLITVVWVVGITNALNFVDSMDGLAAGLAGLAAGFFMLVTYDAGQLALSALATLMFGACMGAYFFNSLPARMFMGDAGAQWLGFCLAGIGIAYTPLGFQRSQSWFVPILLVGVPLFDTALIMFSRLRRRRSLVQANFDHTYHRLVGLGVVPARAVLAMHVAGLLAGCVAFIGLSLAPLWANILFGGCVLAGVAAAWFLDTQWNLAGDGLPADTPPAG